MSSDCQKVVSANAQPILPRLGEDEEGGPFNDERKPKKQRSQCISLSIPFWPYSCSSLC